MGNSVFFFSSFFLSQTKVMVIMRMMMTIAICRARICPRNKSILTALKKNAHQKKKEKKKAKCLRCSFDSIFENGCLSGTLQRKGRLVHGLGATMENAQAPSTQTATVSVVQPD